MNKIKNGWLSQTRKVISPHFDERPDVEDISLLVIHYISCRQNNLVGDM